MFKFGAIALLRLVTVAEADFLTCIVQADLACTLSVLHLHIYIHAPSHICIITRTEALPFSIAEWKASTGSQECLQGYRGLVKARISKLGPSGCRHCLWHASEDGQPAAGAFTC